MDRIITVCDSAAGEACPVWPGRPAVAHWSLPDPVTLEGISEHERYAEFERIAQQLLTRLRHFLARLSYEQERSAKTA